MNADGTGRRSCSAIPRRPPGKPGPGRRRLVAREPRRPRDRIRPEPLARRRSPRRGLRLPGRQRARGDGRRLGWVSLVGVIPSRRGRGIGESLLCEAFRRFRARGLRDAALNVASTTRRAPSASRRMLACGAGRPSPRGERTSCGLRAKPPDPRYVVPGVDAWKQIAAAAACLSLGLSAAGLTRAAAGSPAWGVRRLSALGRSGRDRHAEEAAMDPARTAPRA